MGASKAEIGYQLLANNDNRDFLSTNLFYTYFPFRKTHMNSLNSSDTIILNDLETEDINEARLYYHH